MSGTKLNAWSDLVYMFYLLFMVTKSNESLEILAAFSLNSYEIWIARYIFKTKWTFTDLITCIDLKFTSLIKYWAWKYGINMVNSQRYTILSNWIAASLAGSTVDQSWRSLTDLIFRPARVLHVWSWSDCGLFQPLLRHLCRHRGQRSSTGRCPERQPLREDPHCGNLRQCNRPLWCHCSYSAGKWDGLLSFCHDVIAEIVIMWTKASMDLCCIDVNESTSFWFKLCNNCFFVFLHQTSKVKMGY